MLSVEWAFASGEARQMAIIYVCQKMWHYSNCYFSDLKSKTVKFAPPLSDYYIHVPTLGLRAYNARSFLGFIGNDMKKRVSKKFVFFSRLRYLHGMFLARLQWLSCRAQSCTQYTCYARHRSFVHMLYTFYFYIWRWWIAQWSFCWW